MEPVSKSAGICLCVPFGQLSSGFGFCSSSKRPRGVLALLVLPGGGLETAGVTEPRRGELPCFSPQLFLIHTFTQCHFTTPGN